MEYLFLFFTFGIQVIQYIINKLKNKYKNENKNN